MMPNTEAIEEEAAENITRVGGMFKRNSYYEEDEN